MLKRIFRGLNSSSEYFICRNTSNWIRHYNQLLIEQLIRRDKYQLNC